MKHRPIAAGKSSFGFVDENRMFSEMGLKEDTVFLDVACGAGAYSIAASEQIGPNGIIHAVDLWKEGIEALEKEIEARQIKNIHSYVSDVSKHIPVSNGSIDVCMIATALHDLIQDNTDKGTMLEINRVLKSRGMLAVIEFKKIEGPPGPPVSIKLSPKELEEYLYQYSYHLVKTVDVGHPLYLSIYMKKVTS